MAACSECGYLLETGETTCPRCGAGQTRAQAQPKSEAEPELESGAPSEERRGPYRLIGAGAFAAVAIGILILVVVNALSGPRRTMPRPRVQRATTPAPPAGDRGAVAAEATPPTGAASVSVPQALAASVPYVTPGQPVAPAAEAPALGEEIPLEAATEPAEAAPETPPQAAVEPTEIAVPAWMLSPNQAEAAAPASPAEPTVPAMPSPPQPTRQPSAPATPPPTGESAAFVDVTIRNTCSQPITVEVPEPSNKRATINPRSETIMKLAPSASAAVSAWFGARAQEAGSIHTSFHPVRAGAVWIVEQAGATGLTIREGS